MSAVRTSVSIANASSAASVIAEIFRSASARRRFGADASVCVFVLVIVSVDGHRLRVERQLREEVLRSREDDQCHHACEASDKGGDQKGVPDAGGCLRAEDRSVRAG